MTTSEEIEIIDRMATAIAGIMQATGHCDPEDLIVEDFSPREISHFWAMALALASIECDGSQQCLAK